MCLNLPIAVHENRILRYFSNHTLKFHDDMADSRNISDQSTPDLDVKILISCIALGCKNIVAEPREMKDVPIKGFEVEVAPCAAHAPIVSRV